MQNQETSTNTPGYNHELLTPVPGLPLPASGDPERKEVAVSMASGTEDTGGSGGGASSTRRSRVNSHTHSHSHSHGRSRAQHCATSEPLVDVTDASQELAEPSASASELRYLYRWLQKSLPFLILLSSKLVIQHAVGESHIDWPGYWKPLNWSSSLMLFVFRFIRCGRPPYKLPVCQQKYPDSSLSTGTLQIQHTYFTHICKNSPNSFF